jgi:hypothetical protein
LLSFSGALGDQLEVAAAAKLQLMDGKAEFLSIG